MDSLIPLFVAIPLISAFLIMLLGKLVKGFHKYFAPLTLLALLLMSVLVYTNLGILKRLQFSITFLFPPIFTSSNTFTGFCRSQTAAAV